MDVMPLSVNKVFGGSALSDDYAKKASLTRYTELMRAFPNTLIFFAHDCYYYGFDATAVALNLLFGFKYYKNKQMLIVKIKRIEFEAIAERVKARGLRYIIDDQGSLTFVRGKKFMLQESLSYYEANMKKLSKRKAVSSRTDNYIKQGRGWSNDAWTPGLPSSRFYRKKVGK